MSSDFTPEEEPQDGTTDATVLAAEAIQEIQHVHQILQSEKTKKNAKAASISPQRIAKHFLLLDRETHEPRFSPAQIEAALRMPNSAERDRVRILRLLMRPQFPRSLARQASRRPS